MIGFFRRFFQSKVGIVLTLAFLGLIAFAFASSDVANTNTFGGVAGGDRVAIVGDSRISTSELESAARNALRQAQQQNPTLTMEVFIADGGLEEVLDQMIQRTAVAEFAKKYGMRAGDRLVDSEIVQIPAFRGPDGNFDQEIFRAALAQQRTSEAEVREDLELQLLANQVMLPANTGGYMPKKLARRYAALFRERRTGELGLVPSAVFAPTDDPSEEQLSNFYKSNQSDFIRPERRVLRYATFGDEVLKDLRDPTEAEIAARYERDKEQYEAKEERRFTQLVVPTQAAARAILDQVAQGTSLNAAAQAQGLQTREIEPVSKAELANQASQAVANAAFTAGRGTIATPARGSLGWYVLRVDGVESTPARPLAAATAEITEALKQEQRQQALAELTEGIEDRFADGEALSEVAESLGAELTSTRELTADGRVYGAPNETAPEELQRALQPAFAMDESEPQLGQLPEQQKFLIFDVSEITPSAAAPLEEIKDQVTARWKITRGHADARKAADRVAERVKKGSTLAAALREEEKRLPPTDNLNISREELARMGQRVPPPIALFFSMAEGTVKQLEAPQDQGWFLVSLNDIEVGELKEDDPLVEGARGQLSGAIGAESVELLSKAILADIGVEKNEAGIEAVKRRLTGGS